MADNAVSYTIKVAGTELTQEQRAHVQSITVKRTVNEKARATIVLSLWNDNTIGIAEDDPILTLFEAGKDIEIDLAYAESETPSAVFSGETVESRVTFGSPPSVEVGCQCNSIKLQRSKPTRVFSNTEKADDTIQLSDVVNQVVEGVGLSAQCDLTVECRYLIQKEQTDWEFLLRLAKANGACLYVQDTTVYLQAVKTGSDADATHTWGTDLRTLNLELDISNAASSVTYSSTTAQTDDGLTSTVSLSDLSVPMASELNRLLEAAGATTPRVLTDSGDDLDADTLKRKATAYLTQMVLRSARGSAKVAGSPSLQLNTLFEVKAAGKYSGVQYVNGVTHKLTTSDFTTDLAFGLKELKPPAQEGSSERPTSSASQRMSPAFGGLVLAKVESFEDDAALGRIKVSLPWMGDDAQPLWAALAAPGAGPQRGFMAIPEPGDQVILAFLENDASNPVVIGSLWNQDNALPDQYDTEENNPRAWVSRSGHQIVLDDTDSKQQVLIKSQAGQTVLIDDTENSEKIDITDKAGNDVLLDAGGTGKIVLTDKTGNTVTLDDSGISLTAASGKDIKLSASSGNIELDAMAIKGTGQQSVDMSSPQTTVEGTGQLNLNGAQISIQGSAQVSANAPMIMIN